MINIKASICDFDIRGVNGRLELIVRDSKELNVGKLDDKDLNLRTIENEKDRGSVIKAMEPNSKQTNQIPNPNTIRRPEEKEPNEDMDYVKNHKDDMII